MSRVAARSPAGAVEGGSVRSSSSIRRISPEAPACAAPGGASTAGSPTGPRALLASAAAAVESFLLEPAEPEPAALSSEPPEQRPVICVFGIAPGCGTTVVARALAAELAARDPDGAAAVACDAPVGGVPLATHAASRLARLLEDVPGAAPRAIGRLCLVGGADPLRLSDTARHHAPLVIDAGSDCLGGAPAAVADRALVVTTNGIEPALARVGAECIARVGPTPVIVLNRAPHDQSGAFALPNSPMGARLALGGREARGELGRAIAELADLCEEPA